ncbi:MAG: hypothetical protein KDC58_00845 [Cyclobacteriaceae bacterium]|nr:hypothetical protein [Cyclobacteriaceae bacterium]
MEEEESIKSYFLVLGILQSIIAVGAIIGGIGMCMDPSGRTDGISLRLLHESPFKDYWYPGLFLLIVHGLGNILAAIISFAKRHISGVFGMAMGAILIAWVVLQIYWIGFSHRLQSAFLVFGTAEVFLGYLIYRDVQVHLSKK